jgi:hypothetical protein
MDPYSQAPQPSNLNYPASSVPQPPTSQPSSVPAQQTNLPTSNAPQSSSSSFPGNILNTFKSSNPSDAPIDQGGDTILINNTSYPAKTYNGQRVAFKTRFLLSDQAYVPKATGDGYEWINVKLDKATQLLTQNGGRRRRRLTKRRKSRRGRKTRIGKRKRSTTKRF